MSSYNARSDAGVVRLRDVFIDVSMSCDIGCVCNAMGVRGIA
ncbi:hypothetical protein [Xanthomonas hortorum]|uniref:Uncharacterized protein n=1 Tax=Xanthomonas hortorum TaxID=56454 RepID=A0AA47IBS8_9XANT|nr:hypothetical protein [Xanthomonas hortorum]WAH63678.1 hypothetical protein OEG85_19875 [Xanthomonas hortorum]